MSRDMTHQRQGAISNAHVGTEFEAKVGAFLSVQGIVLRPRFNIQVGVSSLKKDHEFDLGCERQKIIVECKSHKWTKGTIVPSAKLTNWNEAMYYFSLAPTNYKKVMFVLRDECAKRGVTLATYYLRKHAHLVPPGVEFWEYDEATRDAMCIRPAV